MLTPCPACAALVCFVAQASYRGRGRGDKKSQKFELTEEQKQEIREAFDLFDTDGSGKRLLLPFVYVFGCSGLFVSFHIQTASPLLTPVIVFTVFFQALLTQRSSRSRCAPWASSQRRRRSRR